MSTKKFPYLSVDRLTNVITYRWLDPVSGRQRSATSFALVPMEQQPALEEQMKLRRIKVIRKLGKDIYDDSEYLEFKKQFRARMDSPQLVEEWQRKEVARIQRDGVKIYKQKAWDALVDKSRRKMEEEE